MSAPRKQQNCDSCWAIVSTALTESYLAIKNGDLQQLSVEYILECTSGSGCRGGYVNRALELIVESGLPLEATYPFAQQSMFSIVKTPGICKSTDRVHLPIGTHFASKSNLTHFEMKTLLALSPVVALMDGSDKAFLHYRSGLYSCPHKTTKDDLSHAVLVIGFD